MAVQMILGLTILVGVHEWGHFIAARKFGMKVEKFFIFIPPKIWSKKIGDTEYGLGSIPLGGFVKISGMVDESMDKEQMNQPPQPWEFRSKPAWQRLIVMLGGIIVNIIVGVFIFVSLTAYTGENYIPIENTTNGIFVGEIGKSLGLKTGDQIIKVNGQPIKEFNDVYSMDVFLSDNASYTALRNGNEVIIQIPSDFIEKMSSLKELAPLFRPLTTFSVGQVMPESNAEKGGLIEGDSIIKIARTDVLYFEQFSEDKKAFKGKVVPVKIIRKGEPKTLNIEVGENGELGFYAKTQNLFSHRDYSIMQAIPVGTAKAFSVITDTFKGFGKVFKGDVAADKAIQGPIGIAQMFGGTFNWIRFWGLCGMLSMVLAFMNLLPIPALDGGHATMLLVEIFTGKKPSDKLLEYLQMAGMILLLTLMVFAFSNDIFKLFSN